jgi:hypothetical protein
MTAEPGELEDHVLRHAPKMVVCNEATGVVLAHDAGLGRALPGYGPRSVIGMSEERSTVEEMKLCDLPSIIDRVERSPRPG